MSRISKVDPSRTRSLRREFRNAIMQRMQAVAKELWEMLVVRDELDLKPKDVVMHAAYQFLTTDDKMRFFQAWLRQHLNSKLMTVEHGLESKPWTAKYINSAFRQGVLRSYTDANPEIRHEPMEFQAGSRAQFLKQAFRQPEAMSKVRILTTRAFNEMEGISVEMSKMLSRKLAEGLVRGEGPFKIAREMRKSIGSLSRSRAERIARTEIINAHAEGQLQAMEEMGLTTVTAEVELLTADDQLVCDQCKDLEGREYTLEEAHGVIPVHPNCRCAWKPVIKVGGKKVGQRR